jgi:hypothetical protein
MAKILSLSKIGGVAKVERTTFFFRFIVSKNPTTQQQMKQEK